MVSEGECLTHEKVVMRSPVKPNAAVQAGIRSLKRFTIRITMKLSQKDRPMEPPNVPVLSVATAMFALSLSHTSITITPWPTGIKIIPESARIPPLGRIDLALLICHPLNPSCFDRKYLHP